MYKITLDVRENLGEENELILFTKSRSAARAMQLLAQENKLICMVHVEQAPRVVKFKGVSPEGGE